MQEYGKISSLSDLHFDPSFFNDEIREGFYVTNMMKAYWAGQIKVLAEIAKICDRHNLRWFAEYGTLIGVIRHGGYIPWDDDLDICMLRKDYEVFLTAAKEELPKGYQLLTVETETEYKWMLARVLNAGNIDYGEKRLEDFFGCPYTIGVDIFPMDNLNPDKEAEDKRLIYAEEIVKALNLLDAGKQNSEDCRKILANIERQNHVILHRKGHLEHELLLLTDQLYQKYTDMDVSDVAYMPFWVNGRSHRFPKEIYLNNILAKFENTMVNISPLYEEMLKIEYGNYMKIHRTGGLHDYPVYKEQESILRDHLGENPFRYTFPKNLNEILKRKSEKVNFYEYCEEVVGVMKTVDLQLNEFFLSESYDIMYQLLEECQPMAISLGTEIEKRDGRVEIVIDLLEKYCEKIYICHESLADGSFNEDMLKDIDILIAEIGVSIKEYLLKRKKKILFLPCSPMWWGSMSRVYYEKFNNPDNECIVITLPCCQKNLKEEIVGFIEDECSYPKVINENLTWDKFDLEESHFDEIIFQFPFDGWNRSMTIPEKFCSDILAKHTDILIYCPCFVPKFYDKGNEKLYESLKTLVEQPAVVNADLVVLHSEKEKNTYFLLADELTHGKYTDYWKNIFTEIEDDTLKNECYEMSSSRISEKKRYIEKLGLPIDCADKRLLLYHIGISSLLQYKERALAKLKESVYTITSHIDKIMCIFSLDNNIRELERIAPKLWKEYLLFRDMLKDKINIILDESGDVMKYIDVVDGYYGDGDEVAHRCRNKGIPVMLRKADLE